MPTHIGAKTGFVFAASIIRSASSGNRVSIVDERARSVADLLDIVRVIFVSLFD